MRSARRLTFLSFWPAAIAMLLGAAPISPARAADDDALLTAKRSASTWAAAIVTRHYDFGRQIDALVLDAASARQDDVLWVKLEIAWKGVLSDTEYWAVGEVTQARDGWQWRETSRSDSLTVYLLTKHLAVAAVETAIDIHAAAQQPSPPPPAPAAPAPAETAGQNAAPAQHEPAPLAEPEPNVEELQQELEQARAALGDLVQLSGVQQDVLAAMQKETAAARAAALASERRAEELEDRNEQLRSALALAERELHALREQLAAQNEQPPAHADAGAPIEAVIRTIRTVSGVTYASISAGSADGVAAGMVFDVITAPGSPAPGSPGTPGTIGTITIEQVEPHESIGRIDGPSPDKVTKGSTVRAR